MSVNIPPAPEAAAPVRTSAPRAPLPPIRFGELASALLLQAEDLLNRWLPGGKPQPPEYVCGSLSGGEGRSCSINMRTGMWSDFQSGEAGGDLLSLYAAIHELPMSKAARQVAHECGLEDVAGIVLRVDGPAVALPPRPAPPPAAKPAREPEGWRTVTPVPEGMPAPTYRHQHRAPEDIEHLAEYRVGADLFGFVVRFRTSDGGKDTLPYTWCVSARDNGCRWHWKQWDEPRPLYFPGHQLPEGRTVILVEGEKKGDALQAVLDGGAPGVYCVAGWPGGGKAWKKAQWSWLQGATVILWPDCDAKHEPLTKAERSEYPDPAAQEVYLQSKPLLPAEKQPGLSTMLAIGATLRADQACTVQILPIPQPGTVVDGWDCGDAINVDGWDFARVQGFLARASALPDGAQASAPARAESGGSGGAGFPPEGPADAEEGDDPFDDHIMGICRAAKIKRHELQPNRSLIIAALRKAPALRDCVAYDELRDAPVTRVKFPWRDDVGPLVDQDDLRCGDWVTSTYGIKSASRAALAEAIETVADERRFHPFRDWVRAQVWDKRPRLEKWLMHVLGVNPDHVPARRRRYYEMVGRFILLGHVARVMDPGCKFDYSVVLEGRTGMGKSTLPEYLIGEQFFSDTHFDIGSGKDGYEQLAGIIAYELSEMTAFRRADSEQVKAFFTSRKDRYRGAYGRYVTDHPRQCVIWCTTNKRQYLFDVTGNRRFWPVAVDAPLNVEWLKKWRGQLFAEALELYQAGERTYPTREEEAEYFVPEQRKRLVETSVQARLYDMLTRDGAPGGEGKLSSDINQHTTFITMPQLTAALGSDAAKSTTLLEGQIRDWLTEQGWERARESTGQRRWGYRQPEAWPPKIEEDDADEVGDRDGPQATAEPSEGGDDEPF